ncbi:MAG: MlaD family protein [Leptolyngbya sp. IPPAS B-1204]|nr:MCE family protein [Elainella sp. C42_A2020_010]RNJ71180.1 MAG: MCE family protein [Leptolyngbya sp. IPPAS B-1204]
MRARTIREGSVGLLILLGLVVFGGLFLWLRGFSPGRRSYQATIRFPNAEGMQVGAPVRYRGVVTGKISAIRVSANYAEVDIRVQPATVIIPRNVTIEAKQSGLVGETFIDITPNAQLADASATGNPLSRDCNDQLIICDGSYLQGTNSVTLTELIGSVIRFTNLFSSPEFFGNVQTLTRNFAAAAEGVDTLAGEVTVLSKTVRSELGTLSNSAQRSADSVGQAAQQIGTTAGQFGLTAQELQGLIAENRTSLVSTLDSLNQTVGSVQSIVSTLAPTIEEGEFLANLETLSANAAEASANLRNLSEAVGTPENLLLLQQTLDSARATFQNAQKITSDLDELTGDPNFRQNILRLVNGLSGLVSSTQELQQQTQVAQMLNSTAIALEATEAAPTGPEASKTKRNQTEQSDTSAQDEKQDDKSEVETVQPTPLPDTRSQLPAVSAPSAQDLLLPSQTWPNPNRPMQE